MKIKIEDLLFTILMIAIGILIYKLTYSKTLASFPFIIILFYLLENREIFLRKKEEKI
ncbi:MAG: hypothetical protein ACP5GJ_00550 [Nanopusillaceae archaeon]|jgi:hypothetical protein